MKPCQGEAFQTVGVYKEELGGPVNCLILQPKCCTSLPKHLGSEGRQPETSNDCLNARYAMYRMIRHPW